MEHVDHTPEVTESERLLIFFDRWTLDSYRKRKGIFVKRYGYAYVEDRYYIVEEA